MIKTTLGLTTLATAAIAIAGFAAPQAQAFDPCGPSYMKDVLEECREIGDKTAELFPATELPLSSEPSSNNKGLKDQALDMCATAIWNKEKYCNEDGTAKALPKPECPPGKGMATWKGKKMGCMTPAEYELWNAQMEAAWRANRTPAYVPVPTGPSNAVLQQQIINNQLYNQHQQWRLRNGY